MRRIALTIGCIALLWVGQILANGGTVPQNSVTVYPGSLKTNIGRIAKRYGWDNVVWDVNNDYHWVGTTRIRGNTASSVLGKLLTDYPLQARFYQGNHILVIVPRAV